MMAPTEKDGLQEHVKRLLEWYAVHGRPLPWRRDPTPYEVLVSEVMLQQTQVGTVLRYYPVFLSRFPDVVALAKASQEDVLAVWAGLGYYSRARNLHAAARLIVEKHEGAIPFGLEELLGLPGVGEYTARAVRLFAYGVPEVPVDANVERVVSRLAAEDEPVYLQRVRRRIEQLVREFFAHADPPTVIHALMDLGATVCLPRNPACAVCPLRAACRAVAEGRVAEIPVKGEKRPVTSVNEWRIVLVDDENRLLLWKRRADQRWGGLWEFLRVERHSDESATAARRRIRGLLKDHGLRARVLSLGTPVVYSVTRYRVSATPWFGRWLGGSPKVRSNGEHTEAAWISFEDLEGLPMSTPQRRIALSFADLFARRDPRASGGVYGDR